MPVVFDIFLFTRRLGDVQGLPSLGSTCGRPLSTGEACRTRDEKSLYSLHQKKKKVLTFRCWNQRILFPVQILADVKRISPAGDVSAGQDNWRAWFESWSSTVSDDSDSPKFSCCGDADVRGFLSAGMIGLGLDERREAVVIHKHTFWP